MKTLRVDFSTRTEKDLVPMTEEGLSEGETVVLTDGEVVVEARVRKVRWTKTLYATVNWTSLKIRGGFLPTNMSP